MVRSSCPIADGPLLLEYAVGSRVTVVEVPDPGLDDRGLERREPDLRADGFAIWHISSTIFRSGGPPRLPAAG